MSDNPMMPQGPGPSAPTPSQAHMAPLAKNHQAVSAMFDATQKALKQSANVRQELDKLTGMGDVVTGEDVIEGAGRIVAKGGDPLAMAGVLADMPSEGGSAALAGWIAQHDMAAKQHEAMLQAANEVARHQLGVSSLHMIAAHSMNPQSQAPSLAPAAPQNQLSPPTTPVNGVS